MRVSALRHLDPALFSLALCALAASWLWLGACSGSSIGVAGAAGDGSGLDASEVDGGDSAPGADTVVTPDVADTLDSSPEVVADTTLPVGAFLSPCEDNAECLSGWCIDHLGASVCTKVCEEECPPGWGCRPVNTEPDVVFICVSDYANLCLPCASPEGCKAAGGREDVCVRYGDAGAFCGGACGADDSCPEGFVCQDAETIDGHATRQCVSSAGECACTDKAVRLSLWTPCVARNDLGACQGERVCGAEGLSACDAASPAAELCDGEDNDCDGQTDEEPCDDGNPCTDDRCDPDAGCQFVPNTDACDDGDPCTVADRCEAGLCVAQPMICDDDNPCTDEVCVDGLCSVSVNAAECDDGDPCTVADQCEAGACAGFAVSCECQEDADCGALEDGDVCNGTLVCDTASVPFRCVIDPATVITCPAPSGVDGPCLASTCDPQTGACGFMPASAGAPCEDGDACSVGDRCVEGLCVAGAAANCNDGNPCTDDACAPERGCVYEDNAAPCEDGDACSAGDRCADGGCHGGAEVICDDHNPCTDDRCDPELGCVFTPNADTCDDGNACTMGEACVDGACVGGVAVACDDGNLCTDDRCEPELGCVHGDNANPCDDSDLCTVGDTCAGGVCVPGGAATCEDGNPCTDDRCEPELGCVFAPNSAPCDDGNACTEGDTCEDAGCKAGAALDCDDGNPCTDDLCDQESGCFAVANTDPCDDGSVCTQVDSCVGGLCVGADPLGCLDDNPCTDDLCDDALGCVFPANTDPCDDGDLCTTLDTCAGGTCVGGPELACDDNNTCTDALCDPLLGCQFIPNTDPCDDGDACTEGDTCQAGACVQHTTIDCDDADPCTADRCEPSSGCVNLEIAPCCGNGLVEDGEECDDDNRISGDGCSESCACEPDCAGKVCGDDGCGGRCEPALPLCEEQRGVCGGATKTAALCVDGAWAPCAEADYVGHSGLYQADEALCDGHDNDCDGATDEGFGYGCADLSCTGSGLIHTIPDGCIDDGGGSAGGDSLQVYCCDGTARLCLSGESCPWRGGCVSTSATCSRSGLGSDYMANAWCSQWRGHDRYNCTSSGQAYF